MKLELLKPSDSLNKAYRKTSLRRDQVESFKTGFKRLFSRINEKESEENLKNIVADFLKEIWYKSDYEINTKDRKDLVIHNGKSATDAVGVILEAKKPGNKPEMISVDKPNAKAFHELILYYLRERVDHNNSQIKHLIATNIWEWYIFDGVWFEKNVFRNKKLKDDYDDFKISGQDTRFFYDEIAAKFLDSLTDYIPCSYFSLKDYEEWITNDSPDDDNNLLDLYKVFSPEHLLTKSFVNDSNTLNREFYTELLHIIGLGETKEKSKKLIGRKAAGMREDGSILENTINVLRSRNRLYSIDKPEKYGDTEEERLFSAGLELVITWLNRILFLKLLEGQLIAYHQGDKSYAFLHSKIIEDFDQLNELFFDVLAIPEHERLKSVREKFGILPYLNSSLFEESDLERKTITIAELKDRLDLSIHPSTVLRDSLGKRITGHKNTLQYLFEFLDAFDFSSDSKAEIQEQNKSLISASVLGLIFEKINGYKDGSFFTPGFITMYMCRETIRRAVVQKFNDAKGWNCEDFGQLYNKIDDKKEANSLINSLKICDPAVGSGHFLVSALNEIIAIKSELKILLDRQGRTLRDYQVEVVNDELVITDDDGRFFRYHPKNEESRRVQEALFHEKQTIIENCLFGVDINSKSVMICRLRLWIELLKNAYYLIPKGDSIPRDGVPLGVRLETLPNLDINIKCGNSLISRFPLDADLGEALRKSKWNMDSYRLAVMTYRNAESKEQKRAMEKLITDIKSDFETEVTRNDKRLLKLNKLKGELFSLTTQPTLFEMTKAQKAAWEKQVKKFTGEISSLETALEEVRSNRIYENAFEWRFEFPEVLDNDGKFVGFDVVIGNPPYIEHKKLANLSPFLKEKFEVYYSSADISSYFFELGSNVLRERGIISYINTNKFFKTDYGKPLRNFISKDRIYSIINFEQVPIFDEALVSSLIIVFEKSTEKANTKFCEFVKEHAPGENFVFEIEKRVITLDKNALTHSAWSFSNQGSNLLLEKIFSNCKKIKEIETLDIKRGVTTGFDPAFIISKEKANELNKLDTNNKEIIKPLLKGAQIKKYHTLNSDLYLIFTRRGINIEAFPILREYLNFYFDELKPKKDIKQKGRKPGEYKWFEIQDNIAYYKNFDLEKIIWPLTADKWGFALDTEKHYLSSGGFFLVSEKINLKYLLALVNSNLMKFIFTQIGVMTAGGAYTLKKSTIEEFPIPEILENQQYAFINLVTQILALKKSDPHADTSALEYEIDQLVYDLYGLTEEERRIVEGGMN